MYCMFLQMIWIRSRCLSVPLKPVPCDLQAWAKGELYEACVEATAGPDDGTVLRAPTEKQGLIPLCQDTFLGKVAMHIICAYFCIMRHTRFHHLMLCMSTRRLICYMGCGSLLTDLRHQLVSGQLIRCCSIFGDTALSFQSSGLQPRPVHLSVPDSMKP